MCSFHVLDHFINSISVYNSILPFMEHRYKHECRWHLIHFISENKMERPIALYCRIFIWHVTEWWPTYWQRFECFRWYKRTHTHYIFATVAWSMRAYDMRIVFKKRFSCHLLNVKNQSNNKIIYRLYSNINNLVTFLFSITV